MFDLLTMFSLVFGVTALLVGVWVLFRSKIFAYRVLAGVVAVLGLVIGGYAGLAKWVATPGTNVFLNEWVVYGVVFAMVGLLFVSTFELKVSIDQSAESSIVGNAVLNPSSEPQAGDTAVLTARADGEVPEQENPATERTEPLEALRRSSKPVGEVSRAAKVGAETANGQESEQAGGTLGQVSKPNKFNLPY